MVNATTLPPAGFGRVIVTTVITAVVYTGLSTSSFGTCPGGMSGNGFVDGAGNPSDSLPTCRSVTFQPQSLVFLILAAICVAAIVLGGAAATAAAVRRIRLRAMIALVAVRVVGTLVTLPAFYSAAPAQWGGGAPPQFWFSTITTVSPMESP
jgi:hypothetical protein